LGELISINKKETVLLKSLLFGVKDSSKVVVWVETEEIDL